MINLTEKVSDDIEFFLEVYGGLLKRPQQTVESLLSHFERPYTFDPKKPFTWTAGIESLTNNTALIVEVKGNNRSAIIVTVKDDIITVGVL